MEFKVSNIIKMEGHFKDERVKRIIEGRNLGKKNSIETLKEKMSMSGVWGVRIERWEKIGTLEIFEDSFKAICMVYPRLRIGWCLHDKLVEHLLRWENIDNAKKIYFDSVISLFIHTLCIISHSLHIAWLWVTLSVTWAVGRHLPDDGPERNWPMSTVQHC